MSPVQCGTSSNSYSIQACVQVGGALSVRHLSLADTDSFALSESILVLVVILLARKVCVSRCLVLGALIGCASEILRFFATGAYRQILFGLVLLGLAVVVRDAFPTSELPGEGK